MRTDGDRWDITTSVGATALGVAAARAVESRHDEPLVEDPYAQAFVDRAGLDVKLPGTPSADADSEALWNTMSTYMGVRSRFFDEFFRAAAGDGVRQVVLLAAGLDARAFRLAWPGDVTVYEVDQEAVLQFKDEVLDAERATTTTRRVPVAVDLRDDWPAALTAAGFDPAQPTAWLAEGLLPYLPAEAETLLFDRLQTLSAPGSRVAVEHFALAADHFADHPRFAEMGKVFGVDVADLIYLEPRERTPEAHLAELGWKTLGASARDLAVAYRRPLDDEVADLMGGVSLLEAVRLAD
ncbi:SAM-dependent methyltransferase [Actinomycetospora termitidis]|uniref:S-adenosyl-L-methionine-dependent methyltransferase n=1 Tax=Actinomycetospora termitidis TaxID=3053470 RepID=A0ABT7MLK1_9PSEU|nr:SAM-dependent methyltransferase [Actinomycetospora sp. Odt1-22]MDL5160333.1 SAM-dependent methyltransferase [Actinomycetospora sp. Odt1-22]